MIKLLFFGRLRDAAGDSERIAAPPSHVETIADLRDWITHDDPDLGAALKSRDVRVIRNHVFSTFDAPLSNATEIAFVPPLSGG